MSELYNSWLRDCWCLQGQGRDKFEELLGQVEAHTEYTSVQTGDIALGYMKLTPDGSAITGPLFTEGLKNNRRLELNIPRKSVTQRGISDKFVEDINTHPDVISVSGNFFFTGMRAMTDICLLAEMSAKGLQTPCPERSALLSVRLPDSNKEVTLVTRNDYGIRKAVAVRGADFTPYRVTDIGKVLDAIEELPEARVLKNKKKFKTVLYEYYIDHSYYTVYALLPGFESGLRERCGMKEVVPFISVTDSAIGDSSFTMRVGVDANGNKVIFAEHSWNHNNKGDIIPNVIETTKGELKQQMKTFFKLIQGLSREIRFSNPKNRTKRYGELLTEDFRTWDDEAKRKFFNDIERLMSRKAAASDSDALRKKYLSETSEAVKAKEVRLRRQRVSDLTADEKEAWFSNNHQKFVQKDQRLRLETLLNFIKESGNFTKMEILAPDWQETKDLILEKYGSKTSINIVNVLIDIWTETFTKSLKGMRAMATVPMSLQDWIAKVGPEYVCDSDQQTMILQTKA